MITHSITSSLPIDDVLHELKLGLSRQSVVILSAEPGAGKSTGVPLSLLEEEWLQGKKIIMLQPRRVAAKSIAHYLAQQLGEKVGDTVGYQVRNEHRFSSRTKLLIVTEGILTRRIQLDPELSDIALVIFDEFHERSIHSDLGLMFSYEIQQGLREDLRLLVMSATMDSSSIQEYLAQAKTINCPGRTHPISIEYKPGTSHILAENIKSAVLAMLNAGMKRDIIVFLPGQSEIFRCIRCFEETMANGTSAYPELLLVPLFGALSLEEQSRALRPDDQGRQKVIFSTNIAETSLTVQGVGGVIDSGLEKRAVFDPNSGVNKLVTGWITISSAKQRAGRAGRLAPGVCIRLWSESQERQFRDFPVPDISSSDLAPVLLQLAQWASAAYEDINWLTAPPLAHYQQAIELLQSLDILDTSLKLTNHGKLAATIPLNPRLAGMLVSAQESWREATILAALLDAKDILKQGDSADLQHRYNVLSDSINGRKKEHTNVNKSALYQALTQAKSLRGLVESTANLGNHTQAKFTLAELLLKAYPERLAKQRSAVSYRYLMANGKGVALHEHDPLIEYPWLVVADCEVSKSDGRIYLAMPISEAEIDNVLGSQFHQEMTLETDKQGRLSKKSVTYYQNLEIASETSFDIDGRDKQQYFRQEIIANGTSLLNWTDICESWLTRVSWLSTHSANFPDINKNIIDATVDQWLLPYLPNISSLQDLKKVDVLPLLEAELTWDQQQFLEKEAPRFYITPSGKKVKIEYDQQQGPMVSVQLQEVFGELNSPLLAKGAVKLRFELLSPARRPIQTTSDLGRFWTSSYVEIAKEMRGRYPKHRWPEEPLKEKAGRSIKPK